MDVIFAFKYNFFLLTVTLQFTFYFLSEITEFFQTAVQNRKNKSRIHKNSDFHLSDYILLLHIIQ